MSFGYIVILLPVLTLAVVAGGLTALTVFR
jgi:hypothetical protein